MKQFSPATKPFCAAKQTSRNRAPLLNSLTTRRKGALSWRSNRLKQGTTMLKPYRLTTRRAAVALSALAIGVVAFSGAAGAAPLQLFPFILTPPVQSAPQLQAPPQADEDGIAIELPARLRRQVVNYATREAPGTIIIDTPNTYLYLVMGHGQAMRYGIGVGRDGFTWSGVQSITKKAEWPDWTPPPEMIARQPYLPRKMAGGPGNPLGARAMYLGGTI